MNEGQMRAEFEAWWKQELLVNLKMDIQEITKYLEKTSQGEYTHAATLMRWKVWKAAIASQEDDLQFLFDEVKTLCQIICNSLPDTPIRGEIQSRAFMIGHYPDVLNANRNLSAAPQPTLDRVRELEAKYNELIMAVASKYPNETRHQTALRYINDAEVKAEQTLKEVNK